MVRAGTVTILCLLLNLWICVSASPQGKSDKEFESLPKAVQSRLFERLNIYIEYRSKHQWSDLYDLHWRPLLSGTKEKYVASNLEQDRKGRPDHLTKFTPLFTRVVSFEKERWTVVIIDGCGEYGAFSMKKGLGKLENLKSTVIATYQDGEWFFDDINPGPNCFDCPREKCKGA